MARGECLQFSFFVVGTIAAYFSLASTGRITYDEAREDSMLIIVSYALIKILWTIK